jgi:hypothetical protein
VVTQVLVAKVLPEKLNKTRRIYLDQGIYLDSLKLFLTATKKIEASSSKNNYNIIIYEFDLLRVG